MIEGEPDQNALTAAWDKIYGEYISLAGDASNKHGLVLTYEIESLNHKITVIYAAIDILRTYRDDGLVKILHSHGFNFPFNAADVVAYHKDLDRVENRAKTLIVQREQKEKELEALQKKSDGGKIGRDYFDNYLVTLSQFIGYHINEETTTVSRYATILMKYVKHCETLKNKANAKRPNR